MLTLADVFEALLNVRPSWSEQVTIADVVVDSRQVSAGALFVALQGETHDGHEYVGDALTRGAAAVLAEERVKSSGLGPSVRVVETSTGVAGLQPGPEPLVPTLFIVPSTLQALHDLAAYWRRRFPNCKIIGVTGSIGKSSTKELIASVLAPQYVTLKSKGNLNNEIGLPLTLLKLNETHQRAVLEVVDHLGDQAHGCDAGDR